MVCRRLVSGILRKAGVIFVPLYENKKISFGFAQDASLQIMNTIWVGGSSQNRGRKLPDQITQNIFSNMYGNKHGHNGIHFGFASIIKPIIIY